MVHRLNQMSRRCRPKVELIQLGSAPEKYGVWTRLYSDSLGGLAVTFFQFSFQLLLKLYEIILPLLR